MRLNFPNSPLTFHRNLLVVCIGAAVLIAGSLTVYAKLIKDMEDTSCMHASSFVDAKTWLQAMRLGLCVFVSGAVYSFFSMYHC